MLRKTFALSLVVVLACSLFFSVSVKSVSANSGTTQIYFGAFVGPSHKVSLSQLEAFETTINKPVSIWHWFQYWNRAKDWENSPYFEPTWMDECRNHGSIPMITWTFEIENENINYPNLSNVINGDFDSYIRTWAQAAKDWGHPFFVRLMHEFNGGWTPYCEGVNGNTQGQFVQAWRHVVDIFKSIGVTNVNWVWSPNVLISKASKLSNLYPGDAYVDWTGMDGYNWGNTQSFDKTFGQAYNDILSITPTKPLMIAEVGCFDSGYKVTFFNDMFNKLPNNYPNIKAMVYWEGTGLDVSNIVESNPNALNAFKQGIASSYYNSNVYSSLNFIPSIVSGSSNPAPSQTENNQASSRAAFAVVAVLATSAIAVSAGLIAYFRKRRKMLDPSTAF